MTKCANAKVGAGVTKKSKNRRMKMDKNVGEHHKPYREKLIEKRKEEENGKQ